MKNYRKEEEFVLDFEKIFESYGYEKIKLNTFEKYDIYFANKDIINEENLLKIINPKGDLYVLRPDMTLPVVKYFSEEQMQSGKFYYNDSVFSVDKNGLEFNERKQVGIEYLGGENLLSDVEVLDLAIQALEKLDQNSILCISNTEDGKVVKGIKFEGVKEVETPVKLAKIYNEMGADELVFYDITATNEGRELFSDIVEQVANEVFIPLTVGGGINTLSDFDRVLKAGADKVSINSGAIKNPDLIKKAALKYGSQCVVLSIDVKRVDGIFKVFFNGGRKETELEAIEWMKKGCQLGAGEIVVNSIDMDGVKEGFDLELLEAISNVVNVPVVASGGAGKMEDFKVLFKTLPKVDAGLAASIFHFDEILRTI